MAPLMYVFFGTADDSEGGVVSAAVLGEENKGLARERFRVLVFKTGEGKASHRRVNSRQDPATRRTRALVRAETNDMFFCGGFSILEVYCKAG